MFSEKEIRFLNYMRVGRLATTDGEAIHLVPICPVFDGAVFYMATHAKTRKVRNLRKNHKASLLIDQYSEDWMRHVAAMMTGIVEIIEKGSEFEKAKALLEGKYQQYNELFPKCYYLLQADQGGDMGLRSGRPQRTSLTPMFGRLPIDRRPRSPQFGTALCQNYLQKKSNIRR